jgi:hypothetical protein
MRRYELDYGPAELVGDGEMRTATLGSYLQLGCEFMVLMLVCICNELFLHTPI